MLQCHLELPLLVAHHPQIVIGYRRSRRPLYGILETVCGHLTLALRLQGYTEVEEGLDRVWIESQDLLETVYGRLDLALFL